MCAHATTRGGRCGCSATVSMQQAMAETREKFVNLQREHAESTMTLDVLTAEVSGRIAFGKGIQFGDGAQPSERYLTTVDIMIVRGRRQAI